MMVPPKIAPAWAPDSVLPGFEAAPIDIPPSTLATLVRRRAAQAGRAVLYLHGYTDYFFQAHLAEAYLSQGISFYALDLRGHGRSIRPGPPPNFCADLGDYFDEIDAALDLIAADGHGWVLLNGHSTGGLLAALYADGGARRGQVSALFLNSPFFDLNADAFSRRVVAPAAAAIGRLLPTLPVSTLPALYAESLHRDHRGEWEFNLAWKPLAGFPVRAGWLRAIIAGQRRVAAGLGIDRPILVMHSARSARGRRWDDGFHAADLVLNVEDMRRLAPRLGSDVTVVAIEGGLHDLTLSAAPVRARVFQELFGWIARVGQ